MTARTRAVQGAGEAPYELRARAHPARLVLELWQLPGQSARHLDRPKWIAALSGRPLDLVLHRILRRLGPRGRQIARMRPGARYSLSLTEEEAMRLALLFRVLAPMRVPSRMSACVTAIEEMTREETAYWLGLVLHRPRPRRVLAALRMLLTDP